MRLVYYIRKDAMVPHSSYMLCQVETVVSMVAHSTKYVQFGLISTAQTMLLSIRQQLTMQNLKLKLKCSPWLI